MEGFTSSLLCSILHMLLLQSLVKGQETGVVTHFRCPCQHMTLSSYGFYEVTACVALAQKFNLSHYRDRRDVWGSPVMVKSKWTRRDAPLAPHAPSVGRTSPTDAGQRWRLASIS